MSITNQTQTVLVILFHSLFVNYSYLFILYFFNSDFLVPTHTERPDGGKKMKLSFHIFLPGKEILAISLHFEFGTQRNVSVERQQQTISASIDGMFLCT